MSRLALFATQRARAGRASVFSFTTCLVLGGCGGSPPPGPHQATGIKIGEVSDSSAIIWTRLTREAQRVGSGAPVPDTLYIHPETGDLVQDPSLAGDACGLGAGR